MSILKRHLRRPRTTPGLVTALKRLLLVFFIWTVIDAHLIYYRIAHAEREAQTRTVVVEPTRIFIASLHWNNEKILRSDWNRGVLELVRAFGAANVFVSVYESGSWDDSKGALRELDADLEKAGVARKIVLEDETHKDLIEGAPEKEGWIKVSDGRTMPRRIPYLSHLRNLSLQPLVELAENGTTFDQVLFLGDVVFSVCSPALFLSSLCAFSNIEFFPLTITQVPDILNLLKTNNGQYAAACSLDFSKPPSFYDTFALRDAHGHEHATQSWPYFRSAKSRKAMLNAEPVPVSSCWNGIGMSYPSITHLSR